MFWKFKNKNINFVIELKYFLTLYSYFYTEAYFTFIFVWTNYNIVLTCKIWKNHKLMMKKFVGTLINCFCDDWLLISSFCYNATNKTKFSTLSQLAFYGYKGYLFSIGPDFMLRD